MVNSILFLGLELYVWGLIFNLFGTIILAVPLLKSEKDIKKLSTTYWDENKYLAYSFIKDKRTGLLGLSVLVIGFILQIINYFLI